MKTKSRLRKKHIVAAILLLFFVFVPTRSANAQNPWEFLDGFKLVPGSVERLEEPYVAALFVNLEERLLALVIFNATCDGGACEVNRPSAYSVFNAQGFNVRCYVDPRESIGTGCNELEA